MSRSCPELIAGLIAIASLASGGIANAKNCGGLPPPCGPGPIQCACGDTVVESYILTSTLDCSSYFGLYGLKIASGKTLALGAAGVRIIGNRVPESAGVLFDGVSGAKLMGRASTGDFLEITGWERGVQLMNGATNNTVENVTASSNGSGDSAGDYGIDLRPGTSGNVLSHLIVHDNFDEGVHFGAGSFGNTLKFSVIHDNAREQVYLVGTNSTTVAGNTIFGGAGAGVRLVANVGAYVANNLLVNAGIQLDSGSSGNTLFANAILGQGRLNFGDGVNNNVVSAMVVSSVGDHCLEFSSDDGDLPYGNRVTSSTFTCSGSQKEIISNGHGTRMGQNFVCDTTCSDSQGNTRRCVESSSASDDVTDNRNIVTLRNTPCP